MIIAVIGGNSREKHRNTWHHENGTRRQRGPSPKDLRQKPRRNCQRRVRQRFRWEIRQHQEIASWMTACAVASSSNQNRVPIVATRPCARSSSRVFPQTKSPTASGIALRLSARWSRGSGADVGLATHPPFRSQRTWPPPWQENMRRPRRSRTPPSRRLSRVESGTWPLVAYSGRRCLLVLAPVRVAAIIDGHLSKIIDGGFRCRSIVPFPCG